MLSDEGVTSQSVHAHVFDEKDRTQLGCVTVGLQHRTSDPYALYLHIDTEVRIVTWLISREVVEDALEHGVAGYGDVHVLADPLKGEPEEEIRIRLSSLDGVAWVHFLRHDLEEFMLAIPEQSEESQIDWDFIIRRINGS